MDFLNELIFKFNNICIIGNRNSGKTTTLLFLVHFLLKNGQKILVINNKSCFKNKLNDISHKNIIYCNSNEDKLLNYIKFYKDCIIVFDDIDISNYKLNIMENIFKISNKCIFSTTSAIAYLHMLCDCVFSIENFNLKMLKNKYKFDNDSIDLFKYLKRFYIIDNILDFVEKDIV